MGQSREDFRIAVIDDSEISRRVILSELSANPESKLFEFADPLVFLSELEKIMPDMIISDLVMPNIDGYELCRAVRKYPSFQSIPILLLSAMINNEVRAKALQVGVTETIRKPFKSYELFKYVSSYINQARHAYTHSVLLVDDSAVVRRVFAKILKGMDLRVHEAENLKTAGEILKQYPIEMVFLDNQLPDGTGIEWCGKLRRSEEYPWLPILGISGDEGVALSFIAAGADDYVSKMAADHMEILEEELKVRTKNLLKRVTLNKQLQEAVHKEKALNDQKNKLLGTAAHDLRNPIAIILGNVENIADGILSKEEETTALQMIRTVSNHMLTLLNDILDISAIESGVIDITLTEMDLNSLIVERLGFMNAIGKSKNIKGEFVNALGGNARVLIRADRDRLAQVLDNLMSNAIKYSEPGSGYRVILGQDVEGIVVEIEDQGKGIPAEELAGLFDPFKKTSVRATAGEKSTGLGLAIVKKIVELHKGKVWVKSVPGKGSTFSFLLPGGEVLLEV